LNYYIEPATILQLSILDFAVFPGFMTALTETDEPLALYLHIPFCAWKCTYCAFNTYIHLDHLIPDFVSALMREITMVARSSPYHTVSSIYFGGGTPSLLSVAQFQDILSTIQSGFDLQPEVEITVEANPDDLDEPYLRRLRAAGVNRLSIGMQSANAGELELFARRHDNDRVIHAVNAARRAGFDDLSLDLIYGVPHQTLANWEYTLIQATALQPEHLSLYALGLEDGTPMQHWVRTGRLPMPDDDLAADMYDLAIDTLAVRDYEQYEISNWSVPGHACRHNLQYWRNLPYLGLGPGAHGYAGGVRYATILRPQHYIKALQTVDDTAFEFPHTPATTDAMAVDRRTEIAETLMMGLRLTEMGISYRDFRQRFDVDLMEIYGSTVDRFVASGLLETNSERLRLTRRGRLVCNVVFRELV
jgi:oxygen-independent coproporphyrinogen III oxidase